MTVMSQQSEQLMQVSSLQEFFRDSVDAALESNCLSVDNHTSHYVVNLLTLFSRSEELYESTEDGLQLRPLAQMFSDAIDAETPEQRNTELRRLGDVSLFIAGFFADGLNESVVDLDYYIYMGGGAYQSLALHVQGTTRGKAFSSIFAELGHNFQPMVDVLNEVRLSASGSSDEDVLRLYQVWRKTGSERAARKLREQGVLPADFGSRNSRH
ncbi:MAG: hypothetical protein ACR2QG_13005 [Gammaproteobacteria bacterium]